jgi:hypothetical protein
MQVSIYRYYVTTHGCQIGKWGTPVYQAGLDLTRTAKILEFPSRISGMFGSQNNVAGGWESCTDRGLYNQVGNLPRRTGTSVVEQ